MSGRHGWLAGLGLLLLVPGAAAQNYRARYQQVIEPRWLRLQVTDAEAGLYMEGTYEKTSLVNGGPQSTYERFFVGPALSLGLQGSIYHPNFFSFQLTGEGAYGWSEQINKSGGQTEHDESWGVFGNYIGTGQIFPDKPLNGTLYSSYGRSYREYDAYTRATVDTLGYGSRTSYQTPWLQLLTTYAHTEEEYTDTADPYSTTQDLVNFNAQNTRANSGSTFDYTYNQFGYSKGTDVIDHTINVTDNEQFSEQLGLGLGLTAGRHESAGSPEDALTASANLSWLYDLQWSSNYNFNYDWYKSGDYSSETYAGQVGVQHQLYKSLTSALSGNASAADTTSDQDTGYNNQYGVIWSEGYSKILTTDHQLQLNGSLAFNHTDQKSTGPVVNESHTFPLPPAIQAFTLNQLNVDINTIVVTDTSQLITYTRGLDYEVFVNDRQTEIRRLIGGTIPQGATVLVDYQAQPTPAGSYETYTETVGLRLNLWNNLWSLYAQFVNIDNNAPSDIQTLNSTAYIIGTDVTWEWLRTGVEYNHYDSTDSLYWSVRAYQSGSFTLDPTSSFTAGFTESYTDYLDAGREERNFSFTTTYHRQLSRGLRADMFGGVDYRQGKGVEQTLAAFRPELNYTFGRTTIQFSYNFGYNLYLNNEERQQHGFILRVRRQF